LEPYGLLIDQENQFQAIAKIKEIKEQKKEKFTKFLIDTAHNLSKIQKFIDPQMRNSNMKIDLSLETLLSQPAQHGPKVVLLLKELDKYYSGKEGKIMKSTISLLEDTINNISNSLKEVRNKMKLDFLLNTLKNVSKFEIEKKKFLEENQVYLIYLLDDGITLQKKKNLQFTCLKT